MRNFRSFDWNEPSTWIYMLAIILCLLLLVPYLPHNSDSAEVAIHESEVITPTKTQESERKLESEIDSILKEPHAR